MNSSGVLSPPSHHSSYEVLNLHLPLFFGRKPTHTFGLTCTLLCKIPLTPISVELLENTAPNQLVANHTKNVSILFAATITTRSPCRTPFV